jgi:DNA-binding beta-propeller fold protein YncE
MGLRGARLLAALGLLAWGCTSSNEPPPAGAAGSGVSSPGAGGRGGSGGGAGTGGEAGGTAAVPDASGPPQPAPPDAASPPAPADAATPAPAPGGPAKIVLLAGGGMDGDGIAATDARLQEPFGVAVDPMTSEVYIAEYGANRIRRIDGAGMIHTVVGPGAAGAAADVKLNRPHDLLFQPGTRNLFIADTFGNRVWRLDAATGDVKPFAGAGTMVAAGLRGAYCLAFDRAGKRLFVTDNGAGRIEVIDLGTMAVTSIATPSPRVVALDSQDTLYVVQTGGNAIKKVDEMGRAMNLPGAVNAPKRLAVDGDDNLVIADTESSRIRKLVVKTGTIVAVAGGAAGRGTVGGPPDQVGLNRPHGVFEDQMRRLIIADSENNRVLRIER